jgi:hypothetical protein
MTFYFVLLAIVIAIVVISKVVTLAKKPVSDVPVQPKKEGTSNAELKTYFESLDDTPKPH